MLDGERRVCRRRPQASGGGNVYQWWGAVEELKTGYITGTPVFNIDAQDARFAPKIVMRRAGGCCTDVRQGVTRRFVATDRTSTTRRGHCVGIYGAIGRISIATLRGLEDRFPRWERLPVLARKLNAAKHHLAFTQYPPKKEDQSQPSPSTCPPVTFSPVVYILQQAYRLQRAW